jgi:hypothetical protein
VVNGKTPAAQIRQLQQENKNLRAQLEEQYKQAVQVAETIQMVHLARIRHAAADVAAEKGASAPGEFKVRRSALANHIRQLI